MASPALELLVKCDEAFKQGNLELADDLLKRIWNLADDELSERKSKVVKYFAEALVRRAYRLHSANSLVALHLDPPVAYVPISDQLRHAIDCGKKRLHLIDFCFPEAFRYQKIIGAFDVVRVSVILPPFLENILYVRNKMKKFITERNEIELKEVYANSLGEVDVSVLDLERKKDEAVMVLYSYKLHKLVAEPGAMERELFKLKQIKPDIVVIEEVDANHDDSDFIVRLKNSFQYYYDEIDWAAVENYERRQIHNVVGCEGRDQITRYQTLAQWRSRLLVAGFCPIPLKKPAYSFYHEDDGCLVATGSNRSVRFISAWELGGSGDHFNPISNNFDRGLYPSLPNIVQPLQFDKKSFYLNQLAAFAEIYDMLEEVCLGYDLPKAFTWANVNEIMYKKHTLFLQTTFCYPSDWWFNKDEHQQMQFIAGKALQSSEHFHFEENVPLSDDEYDAVAICLENYYKIDDVYVVEFLWPKIETELQESKSLALLIFNDLKNMKKKFVTVRSQFKVLNEQEEVIPKFHQHPLQLLLNDEQMSSNQSRVGDCWGCGEKVSAPCFSCVECGFYIHQKCAEAPFEIHHPFHLDHPLLLQKIPFYCDDGDQCICHFCDKTCERFVYHCSCGLNFHIKCVLFTYDKLKELEHVTLKDLLISPEKNGEELQEPANCFACWEPLEIYAYFSPDCGFNLHKKCADLPLKINDMGHEHPLALQLNNAWHICKKCCCVRLEGFIYCCSSCNYFVHIDCVRLPPNVEVKNHQHPLQLLNEQEELIRNFRTPLPMLPPVLHEQGIQRISNPPVVDDSNPKVGRNSEQAREDKIHTHSKKRNQKNIKGRGENTSCEPLANTENDVVKVDVNNLPMSSAKRRRRRNADIWEEFDLKIIDEKEYAICRHCSTSFDGSSKKGTTHLRNHLKSCKKRAAKDRDKQLAFPIGRGDSKDKSPSEGNSLFDQDRSSMNVARLIIKHQFPLNIVEDGYFRILLNDLQPMFKLQSQEALSSDVVRVYEEEKSKLFDYFDTLTCRFNLTTSLWIRDIDNTTYCCYAVQFIDHNWELKKKILALRSFGNQLDKRIFYESFKNFLVEWNLDKKVCSLTTKNSSSCFEIAEEIRKNWSCFEASHPLSTFYFSSAECIHDLFSRDTPSENIGKSDGVMYSNARLLNNIPDIYNKMSQQDGGRGYPLMNVKSDNNLRTCSLVLAIAVVLDPRLKFDFVEFSYNAIYDRDTARIQLTVIRNAFTGIFNEYASNMYSDTNSSTLLNAEEITMESFHRWYNSKRVKIEATSKTELDKYFQEPVISANPEFDILDWWRQKASSFPILRRMACDILAIPMPSVLSGSSFTEKVMMENPIFHGLNPQIIEAMICSRDWLDSSKQNDSANNVPLKDRAKRKMEDRNSNYGETSSGEKPKASYYGNSFTRKCSARKKAIKFIRT